MSLKLQVNSKNGDYHIDVTETGNKSRSLLLVGFLIQKKLTLLCDETKLTEAFDKPFTNCADI